MHRKHLAVFLLTLVLMLSLSSLALGQGDDLLPEDSALRGGNGDNLPHPLGKQQSGERQLALQQVLRTATAWGLQRLVEVGIATRRRRHAVCNGESCALGVERCIRGVACKGFREDH